VDLAAALLAGLGQIARDAQNESAGFADSCRAPKSPHNEKRTAHDQKWDQDESRRAQQDSSKPTKAKVEVRNCPDDHGDGNLQIQ
jgi:hypothetical protein